jgi:UDP-N-acetylmuramoyl-L-alanyl-D-glutamate--2,6-diaminopimelate ligase
MERSRWLEALLNLGRAIIPRSLFVATQPIYHQLLAITGAIIYRFPSRNIKVVAVTGTKGKTSVVEIVNAFLEEAGYKTAAASTLRFKIAEESVANKLKMTTQGRFFLQRFLRRAVSAGCQYAVIELTSEAAKQFRHRYIELDALIFTNIAPEHIESHGSYENYVNAKLEIAKQLAISKKAKKYIVVNGDDKEHHKFLSVAGNATRIVYHLEDVAPYTTSDTGGSLTLDDRTIRTHLPGTFNLYNILAAASYAATQKVSVEQISEALLSFGGIRGRMERVGLQEFDVIVDYAHTADSLQAVYETFPNRRKLCVLGGTGGGRDHWKRPLMGEIAANYCDEIILTDEDPYDEDPRKIVEEVAQGVKNKNKKYDVVMDRRLAIREAIKRARPNDVILITGKGTDPYIMGPKGSKTPWSDAAVAHEELANRHQNR